MVFPDSQFILAETFFSNDIEVGTNDLSKDGVLILIIRSRSVICKQASMTLA